MTTSRRVLSLWHPLWLCVLVLVVVSCRTGREAVLPTDGVPCLSSKLQLAVPSNGAVLTVGGTMKLRSGERLVLSFHAPLVRAEVARIELTPDSLLLVDRVGRRYVHARFAEVASSLRRPVDFYRLEQMLFAAARAGDEATLTGSELGLSVLDKGNIRLYDFSTTPFSLSPTRLSARYKAASVDELLEMLSSL